MNGKTLLILVIITVFSTVMCYAQQPILGIWIIDSESVGSYLDPDEKVRLGNLPIDKRQKLLDEMASREFTFLEDGGFRARWKFGGKIMKLEGNWALEAGKLTISVNGHPKYYSVEELVKDKLILVPESKNGIAQKLLFTKKTAP